MSDQPKENLLITICNEAIARTQKQIAKIQALIDDNPIQDIIDIDKQLSEIMSQFMNAKSAKALFELEKQESELMKKRRLADLHFKKQKDLSKLFDKRFKYEEEVRRYERAKFHLQFITI